jgi:hypothetical protein
VRGAEETARPNLIGRCGDGLNVDFDVWKGHELRKPMGLHSFID